MSNDIRRITLKANKAIGITKPIEDSPIQGVAFNLAFIAQKDPNLSVKILTLYQDASQLESDGPTAPDEDFSLALEELKKLIK